MKKTYVKGINLTTIKPGDKVWYKQYEKSETDEGVVTRIEDRMVWANYGDGIPKYIIVQDNAGVNPYFTYGTVVEEEVETTQGNKHPQYEVIVHWANGGAIQYYDDTGECWIDYKHGHEFNPSWSYYEFRIKPKTKEIKYRVALMKDKTTKVFNEDISLDDAYDFEQWLDPKWNYVSVEI